jgi:hypothetical protein
MHAIATKGATAVCQPLGTSVSMTVCYRDKETKRQEDQRSSAGKQAKRLGDHAQTPQSEIQKFRTTIQEVESGPAQPNKYLQQLRAKPVDMHG